MLSTAREVRNLGVPVLMVTAEARREQILAAATAGVNGYIVKPFTADVLAEKIDRIFARLAIQQIPQGHTEQTKGRPDYGNAG